mgnify:CR=1 FL=1
MIIAVAGHVDHGKTQLTKALTGINTDRLIEEKARGLSIDLGFAYETLPDGRNLGFVDVPGHEKFIHNMLAGIAGIDLGLLVVATDDGVMPQTREHLDILNLLGIECFIVALTKIDRVSSKRVFEVRNTVKRLFNESNISQFSIYDVSATQNKGIQTLKDAIRKSADGIKLKQTDHYFRMAIDRSFTIKGSGLIVTGMVFSGATNLSKILTVSSNGVQVRVRGIRANNQKKDKARIGERCAFNIIGRNVDINSVRRGNWLLHPKLYKPTRRVDVELAILKNEPKPLKHWTPTHLHIGADHLMARVAILEGGKIAAGDSGLAQLVLARDTFAVHGDHFIIRDQSAQRTIGGGRVVDPYSPNRGRSRPNRLITLKSMLDDNPKRILKTLAEKSVTGVRLFNFSVTHNIPIYQIEEFVTSLGLIQIGENAEELAFCKIRWYEFLDRIVTNISAFHLSKPKILGPTIQDIQLLLRPFFQLETLKIALDNLVEKKRLLSRESRYYLGWHNTKLSPYDQSLLNKASTALSPNFGSPPTVSEAANKIGIEVSALKKILKIGVKLGIFVQIEKNRYISGKALEQLKRVARKMCLESTDGQFTVFAYRDEIRMGRNFAISILEYFDRTGFTRKIGNYRRIDNQELEQKLN